jgi:hypothetical protein
MIHFYFLWLFIVSANADMLVFLSLALPDLHQCWPKRLVSPAVAGRNDSLFVDCGRILPLDLSNGFVCCVTYSQALAASRNVAKAFSVLFL